MFELKVLIQTNNIHPKVAQRIAIDLVPTFADTPESLKAFLARTIAAVCILAAPAIKNKASETKQMTNLSTIKKQKPKISMTKAKPTKHNVMMMKAKANLVKK